MKALEMENMLQAEKNDYLIVSSNLACMHLQGSELEKSVEFSTKALTSSVKSYYPFKLTTNSLEAAKENMFKEKKNLI